MFKIETILDYLESENTKTVDLSAFKSKNPPKRIIKDLSRSVKKASKLETNKKKTNVTITGGIKKMTKPLKTLDLKKKQKKNPVVCLW